MPEVFLSHAQVDEEIAKEFQAHITADFLGLCDVFVSSNLDSLQAGAEWQASIKRHLEDCSILVIMASPAAIQRPWIYVELGAGWVRGIPVIPVCHSGIERGQLPVPLSTFQGINLTDAVHLKHLYGLIAKAVGCRSPDVAFAERVSTYDEITHRVSLARSVLGWVRQLFVWNPTLEAGLRRGEAQRDVMVPANLDVQVQEFMRAAAEAGYIVMVRNGMALGTRVGAQASIFSVTPGDRLAELFDLLASEAQ
jgi:hypothetical protein